MDEKILKEKSVQHRRARPGRPYSSRTDAKKERVENLILSERRVTVEDICAHTGLTHGTVMKIIKVDLK